MIEVMVEENRTSFTELESSIGKLVHLGIMISKNHHFVSRSREPLRRAANRRFVTLNKKAVKDLKLMLLLLETTHSGIDMNLLVFIKTNKDLQVRRMSCWLGRVQQMAICRGSTSQSGCDTELQIIC